MDAGSSVPPGREFFLFVYPALKRRAIFICPSGTCGWGGPSTHSRRWLGIWKRSCRYLPQFSAERALSQVLRAKSVSVGSLVLHILGYGKKKSLQRRGTPQEWRLQQFKEGPPAPSRTT